MRGERPFMALSCCNRCSEWSEEDGVDVPLLLTEEEPDVEGDCDQKDEMASCAERADGGARDDGCRPPVTSSLVGVRRNEDGDGSAATAPVGEGSGSGGGWDARPRFKSCRFDCGGTTLANVCETTCMQRIRQLVRMPRVGVSRARRQREGIVKVSDLRGAGMRVQLWCDGK